MKTTIAGIEFEITHSPSEAPDELSIFLPKNKILIDTEVLQGPTFPNIYTLRGTQFRDPEKWIHSIDKLRALKASYLVPTHGQPVYGAAKVEEVLRMTRDGIQYVHDQTIRHMNKGLTPDQLVEVVVLPPHLKDYKPYLREYYGTVKHAVRQIYSGYLGWFKGDPTTLNPLPRPEKASKLVNLMGGRQTVLNEAYSAYRNGEIQWSAELVSYLISVDSLDTEAKNLKAKALRTLGYNSLSINWRNWYLTSAMELESKVDSRLAKQATKNIFYPPDIIAAMPVSESLKSWSTRLKAESTLDIEMGLGFEFVDLNENYGLEIRKGICQYHESIPTNSNIVLSLTKADYDKVLLGQSSYSALITSGAAQLKGDIKELEKFISYFENKKDEESIFLTQY